MGVEERLLADVLGQVKVPQPRVGIADGGVLQVPDDLAVGVDVAVPSEFDESRYLDHYL